MPILNSYASFDAPETFDELMFAELSSDELPSDENESERDVAFDM